ncbi:MAG: membrane protein insertase YidC [Neisseriaceae bacterium]|nr:membrane protein insertase YidC [Neisseriaceae bacterium]
MNQRQDNSRNLILFIIIAALILLVWNYLFPPPPPATTLPENQTQVVANQTVESEKLSTSRLISVKTDVFDLHIDEASGDIRDLSFTRHNSTEDENKPFVLFENSDKNTYIAQSGLINSADNQYVAVNFTADKPEYVMNGDTLSVKLTGQAENGLTVYKTYNFKQGSYLLGVDYRVENRSASPVKLNAMYRLLRDDHKPAGGAYFTQTYTGPVLYTPDGKFEKVSFEDIAKNKADFVKQTNTGWVGIIQHYFVSAWIMQAKNQPTVCGKPCSPDFTKRSKDGLYSAGVLVPLPDLPAQGVMNIPMKLYAGPQEYAAITQVADNFQLVKDYGKVHLFASPLFWLLQKLHSFVGNWGWAIVLLVILVKIVLYPLNAASYKSMAKMRAVAPKLQELKVLYVDDKMKQQQEMMALYKREKINPLGGCLPILLQIPVFLGLYWALLSSVELRQAPWIGWITDLARTDPYFILPIVMAGTMFLQTYLSPPPTDPMQAKMMKIMPVVFSVMFFFFPAGLVLYWVVNNILSIAQQWWINRQIEKASVKA